MNSAHELTKVFLGELGHFADVAVHRPLKDSTLLVLQLQHALLNGVLGDEANGRHRPLLSDAVRPLYCLVVPINTSTKVR